MDKKARNIALRFTPLQVGYIADCIEPLNVASDIKWALDLTTARPDLEVIPLERHGGILGVIQRDSLETLSNSLVNRVMKKSLESYLMPVQEVIEASSYINSVVDRGLKNTQWDDPAWYVVEHQKKYFGLVNLRQMLEYTNGLREHDLKRAGEIQQHLLVKSSVDDKRFEVFFYNQMAHEIGGDFYKSLKLDEDRYLIVCFDVAGKNLSGAMTTMALGACFATLELLKHRKESPEEMTLFINDVIRSINPPDVFVTAVLFYVDFAGRSVEIHNCGFSPVLVFVPGDNRRVICKTAKPNLPPLGLESDLRPDPPQRISVSAGLRITAYSDGLTDMSDIFGERFGEERTLEFLKNLHSVTLTELNKSMNTEINVWTKEAALADDVTLVDMRFY
jgi:sigma-B regulation protein RsbU (phosphoserine phosphatase)